MTPEQRNRVEMFRGMLNTIKLGDGHGLAVGSLLPVEASGIATLCAEIEAAFAPDDDADAQAWVRAAAATTRLLSGERGQAVVDAWTSARADLPPMEWPSD